MHRVDVYVIHATENELFPYNNISLSLSLFICLSVCTVKNTMVWERRSTLGRLYNLVQDSQPAIGPQRLHVPPYFSRFSLLIDLRA